MKFIKSFLNLYGLSGKLKIALPLNLIDWRARENLHEKQQI